MDFGALALIAISMCIKDIAYVAAEYLVSREKALWASVCDIAGDVASILTYGVGGVLGWNALQEHHFAILFGVLIAIALGSLVGTVLGLRVGQWFIRRLTPVATLTKAVLAKARPSSPIRNPGSNTSALSAEDRKAMMRKDGDGLTLFDRQVCADCGGVHPMSCPRVRRRVIREDGSREVEYFPWGEFPTDQIIWRSQVFEDDETAAA